MEPFQMAGLALVVAAIIGGGLEAAGFKIGVVKSLARQVMLGGLGAVLFVGGTPQVWSLSSLTPAPLLSRGEIVASATATSTVEPGPTQAPVMPTSPAAPTSTTVPRTPPAEPATPASTSVAAPATLPATAEQAAPAPAAPAPILDRRAPPVPGARKDGDRRP